jgi:hypothetical protein
MLLKLVHSSQANHRVAFGTANFIGGEATDGEGAATGSATEILGT